MTTAIDRADSGDIHRIDDLGDDPTRNLAQFVMTAPTEVLAYADLVNHSRRPDATGEIPRIPDLAAAQPIAPLERVADETAVHTIHDSLAGARASLDGELEGPQKPPPPLPPQPRPAAPGKRWYAGRHRAVREEHPVRGLVWFVLLAAVLTAFGMWQVR